MQRIIIQILHLILIGTFVYVPTEGLASSFERAPSQKIFKHERSKKLRRKKSSKNQRLQQRKSIKRLKKNVRRKRFYVAKPKLKRKFKGRLKKKQEKKYSLSFGTTYSESSINFKDGRDSSSLSTNLGASYQFLKNFKLGSRIDGYQDLNKRSEDYGDFHALDLNAQITNLPKLAQWLTITPILGISLPLSKTLTEFDSLMVVFSGGLSNLVRVPGTKLSFNYLLNYAQNIHEFEESLRGFDNKQHIITNSLGTSYQIMNRLSLSVNFALSSRWTYESVYDSVFSSSQSLKYNVHKNLSLRLGHMNSGQTLHSDGRSSNIQLYNENSSGVFVGINAWI